MSWYKRIFSPGLRISSSRSRRVPEGLWVKCDACQSVLYKPEFIRMLRVCAKCGNHGSIGARERIGGFLDNSAGKVQNFCEIGKNIKPMDPLHFRDSKRYKARLTEASKLTGENDALVVAQGILLKKPIVVAAFDFAFVGGSMGAVVGEKFCRGVRVALDNKIPFICFTASGGARMQESVLALFQMAKTSAFLVQMAQARLPFISVLTNPTMGGVSASFAMLGDVIIAEPNALIGFAGSRVIEQTVREKLPEGFQRSEFLLKHGAIDMVVSRLKMRDKLASILAILMGYPPSL